MPSKDRPAYRQANKEAIAAYQREWRDKNREHVRVLNRASYQRNKDARRAAVKEKYIPHPKELLSKEEDTRRRRYRTEQWRKANLGRCVATQNKRRAAKLNRTPPWANLKKIERVYELAAWASRFTDEPLQVDHIVPLQGQMVSGLHVEDNLQILKRSDNCSKGNGWQNF